MGEVDRKTIEAAVRAHCRTLTEGDRDAWLKIWAQDAVLEDPVGVDSFHGIDCLGATFWNLVELTSPMRLEPCQETIVCGNEAVAVLSAKASREGTMREVGPLVDHFTFAPDGKIVAMRAYWDFAAAGYRPEMATPPADKERMVAAIETHCRAETVRDKATWLTLFAEDIVIEDPVGLSTFRGLDALATDFWEGVERARPQVALTDEVIVCGTEAVARLAAEIDHGGQRVTISPIVALFVFDDAGKIRRLRAFMNYG